MFDRRIFLLIEEKTLGGNVMRESGQVKGGATHIAFTSQPEGYQIELIQAN